MEKVKMETTEVKSDNNSKKQLKFVIFNMSMLSEVNLQKLQESVISLAEHGINAGLISSSHSVDTKSALNHHDPLFSEYFEILNEAPLSETDSVLQLMLNAGFRRDESVVINSNLNKSLQKDMGINSVDLSWLDFGSDFTLNLKNMVDGEFEFNPEAKIEDPEEVKYVSKELETNVNSLIEEPTQLTLNPVAEELIKQDGEKK